MRSRCNPAIRGYPATALIDNGAELMSIAVLALSQVRAVGWHYIASGKPQQNAFVESFNGKAALLAEVDAECGKVRLVARRHNISERLIYNWRSAHKAAAVAMGAPENLKFIPAAQRCRHRVAAPRPPCWRIYWSRNTAITCLCIDIARFTPARAWSLNAPLCAIGSGKPPGF